MKGRTITMARRGDFYEDDEPVEKLVAAFEQGQRVVTAPPGEGWGRTLFFTPDQLDQARVLSSVGGESVSIP
jgi:hypothetical protein